ncbi:MAG: hypothetical protein ACXVAX_09575, partial [Pseudobdellovibrio sp.]
VKKSSTRAPASEGAEWMGSESVCTLKFKGGKKGSYCIGVIREDGDDPKQAYCAPVHGGCPSAEDCLADYSNEKNIPRNAKIKETLQTTNQCESNLMGG